MIPYGKQNITQNDIDAVIEVLQSDFITQGPQVPAFETALSAYTSAKYAIATNSATSALHIACQALNLKSGDWLWTSPISFVASANCGRYCDASIDFVDIDPDTYTLCPQALEKKLIAAKKKNRLPKVVIPVHLAGHACNMEAIHLLSKKYHFSIIEDASHAVGAQYQQRPVGCCQYSDITVFSFHPVKIITTGEGGVALTNNAQLAENMSLYRSHGITRDIECMGRKEEGPWYYEQLTLGQNYRLTDIQAALGLSQLRRLDEFVVMRRKLVERYQSLLVALPLTLPIERPQVYSSYHLYIIRLQLDKTHKTHKEVFEELRTAGIGVNLHYIPIYKQPYYEQHLIKTDSYDNAENYYREAISLPLFPLLSEAEQCHIASTLHAVLENK
ncbi:MAG: UDP-4-amino-4,6-dideoxy-N-acetyl-beta-L-altrosamine transaminase [Cellvibrionaceae bacterium]